MNEDREQGKVIAIRTTVRDGQLKIDGDAPEDIKREIADQFERERQIEARRRGLWGNNIGPASMTKLALMFPTLAAADGINPWDVDRLLAWLTGPAPTSGSFWAGLFLLGVWNSTTDWNEQAQLLPPRTCRCCSGTGRVDPETGEAPPGTGRTVKCEACDGAGRYTPSLRCGHFDLFSAVSVWDRAHMEAFEMWVRYPFFP